MKALLCKQFGPPQNLALEEVPSPEPAPGEVLLKVKACGINFYDTLIVQGRYQIKPPLPFAPGGEVAGVVKEIGPGVHGFRVGDSVLAFISWGGCAEEVAVDAERLVPIPHGVDFASAAGFLVAYGTAHLALKDRAALKADETLLVLGAAGGVGIAAIEIGKVLGARVIAAVSTQNKLAICKAHGADDTIIYTQDDFKERLKQLTGGKGVDVVCDVVGGPHTETALRAMAWRGRLLVIGFATGEIPRIPLNLVLLKGCAILGVFWDEFLRREKERSREDIRELMSWLAAERLKPHVSATYPLARGAEALTAIMERRTTGKVVVLVSNA
jgi:NADPH2:quinone reductase